MTLKEKIVQQQNASAILQNTIQLLLDGEFPGYKSEHIVQGVKFLREVFQQSQSALEQLQKELDEKLGESTKGSEEKGAA